MNDLSGKTVGIIGLGQIGGSVAGALGKSDAEIKLVGFDQDRALLDEAISRSMLDVAAGSVAEAIKQSQIVLLATPTGSIIELISEHADLLRQKLLVTDVGSVMAGIVGAAKSAGLSNLVSGHPMAGSEKRGVDSWNSDLFRDCRFFTASPPETTAEAEALMRSLIECLGTETTGVDAEQHDLAFATTSNLVHLLAFGLRRAHGELAGKVTGHEMFGVSSFRGATRVADSDPEMVFQMLWQNRKYLSEALRNLSGELNTMQAALDNNQPELIRDFLDLS